MIFQKLKWLNRKQRGFSLVELLIAISITGAIVGVTGGAIFQVLSINASSKAHMIAIKQVEQAVYWVVHDAQMAQTLSPYGGSSFLTLTWVEWDNTTHTVIYDIVGDEFKRSYSDGGTPTESVIAEYINNDPAMTNCAYTTGGVLTFKVTATVGGFRPATETRTVEIFPRSAVYN